MHVNYLSMHTFFFKIIIIMVHVINLYMHWKTQKMCLLKFLWEQLFFLYDAKFCLFFLRFVLLYRKTFYFPVMFVSVLLKGPPHEMCAVFAGLGFCV